MFTEELDVAADEVASPWNIVQSHVGSGLLPSLAVLSKGHAIGTSLTCFLNSSLRRYTRSFRTKPAICLSKAARYIS
jgi:hypothetical protein